MEGLAGLKTNTRAQLAALMRGTKGTVTVEQAASILGLPQRRSALLLARLARQGWLARVKRGLYVPVPLEAQSTEVPVEDPWVIASELYSPCYIGGWSAAEYWNLTEQIFRSIVVVTTRKVRDRTPTVRGIPFVVRTVLESSLFGLKPAWRGTQKVQVSDPSRTLVDLLDAPKLGGGITSVSEILATYLRSKDFNPDALLQYIDKLGNRAVYKRLGFLLQQQAPDQKRLIDECRAKISKGTSRLDPGLPADRMVSEWNLWIPAGWATKRRRGSRD